MKSHLVLKNAHIAHPRMRKHKKEYYNVEIPR